MKRLLFLLAFLICGPALAQTTEYVCDCQTGAHASCVAGNSGNNGTSASTPKQTIAQLAVAINSKAAGSTVRFCEGGSWNWTTFSIENMNATPTNRITLETYAPPSGATGCARLRNSGGGHGIVTGPFLGEAGADGGYVFRNLCLEGNGTGDTGFFVWNTVSSILWENVRFTGWSGNGIEVSEPTGRDFVIRGASSRIADNGTNGFLGCGDDLVIEDTTFENNNTDGGTQEHAIYLASSGHECKRVVVRNNTFIDNSTVAGECTGGNLTAHGAYDQLVIERNVITVPTATDSCYGISITSGYDSVEYFRRLVVRGNTVVNVGNSYITIHSAPGAIVEDNRVIALNNRFSSGISIVEAQVPPDDANANGVIRNNTCYFSQATTGSVCVQLGATSGTGLRVTNNQAYFGASSSSGSYCFVHPAISAFTTWNYNGCYHGGGGTWSSTYSTLANAQAAGFDANGISADPQFAAAPSSGNSWALALTGSSPGRVAGTSANRSLFDVLRCKRSGSTPSIGAHEYSGTPCLSIRAPVGVR